MFLHSYWMVPLKTTSSVDLFWKEMFLWHFFSCLESVSNLSVYINSEDLESDAFSFIKLYSWNPNTSVLTEYFMYRLLKPIYDMTSSKWTRVNKLDQFPNIFLQTHSRISVYPKATANTGMLIFFFFQKYKVSLYTASKISRHKHLLRERNHKHEHPLKIFRHIPQLCK